MKRKTNKLLPNLIIGLIGFLFILLSLMLVRFDVSKLGDKNISKVETTIVDPTNIKQIKISENDQNIVIKRTNTKKIKIIYLSGSKTYPKLQVEKKNQTIQIQRSYQKSIHLNPFTNTKKKTNKTIIELPEITFDKVKIETNSGKIVVNDIQAKELYAQSNTGIVTIGNVNADKLELHTETGSIHLLLPKAKNEYTIDILGIQKQKGNTNKKIKIKAGEDQIDIKEL